MSGAKEYLALGGPRYPRFADDDGSPDWVPDHDHPDRPTVLDRQLAGEDGIGVAQLAAANVRKARAASDQAIRAANDRAEQQRRGFRRVLRFKRLAADRVPALEVLLHAAQTRLRWYVTRGKPVPQAVLDAVHLAAALLTEAREDAR